MARHARRSPVAGGSRKNLNVERVPVARRMQKRKFLMI